jgi:hypothetical protein
MMTSAQPAEREFPAMIDDDRRTTIINSLRSSKSWTTDYATAFVDDYFESALHGCCSIPANK